MSILGINPRSNILDDALNDALKRLSQYERAGVFTVDLSRHFNTPVFAEFMAVKNRIDVANRQADEALLNQYEEELESAKSEARSARDAHYKQEATWIEVKRADIAFHERLDKAATRLLDAQRDLQNADKYASRDELSKLRASVNRATNALNEVQSEASDISLMVNDYNNKANQLRQTYGAAHKRVLDLKAKIENLKTSLGIVTDEIVKPTNRLGFTS
jgi:chromosome segregation ATPase